MSSSRKKEKQAFCAAIVGRRKSGKTFLLSQLLRSGIYDEYNFEYIVFFSPTLHLQKEFWSKIKPRGCLLVGSLNETILSKMIKDQEEAEPDKRKHILCILDDVGYQSRVISESKKSCLDQLAFAGRHYKISTIQLAQRWSQLSTGYRSQLDHFFWFGTTNKREISAIHEEFSPYADIADFRKMLKRDLVKKHSVLYIENRLGNVFVKVIT